MDRSLVIQRLEGRKESAMALALNILVVIAVLYTLYFCRTLFLPIFVAGFIALFSSPLVRLIPDIIAGRSLGLLFANIVGGLTALSRILHTTWYLCYVNGS